MTPRQLIQGTEQQFSTADLFFGHGTDNALDEAFYLVMAALDLDFDCNEAELDKEINKDLLRHVEGLVDKRIQQRVPVAYLVNQAWFAGYPFYVNEHVLIPRSPLAELITSDFMPWLDAKQLNSILDIGTGSACIAIACAHQFERAKVEAVDVDEEAIKVANTNVKNHELDSRVSIIKSDLFQELDNKTYDLIITNPPYVGNDEMQTLPEEYKHEPRLALETGNNGLEIVERILKQSANHLNENGVLIVEVGNSMTAVSEYFKDIPFTWLEFEHGGEGVFLLTKQELVSYQWD